MRTIGGSQDRVIMCGRHVIAWEWIVPNDIFLIERKSKLTFKVFFLLGKGCPATHNFSTVKVSHDASTQHYQISVYFYHPFNGSCSGDFSDRFDQMIQIPEAGVYMGCDSDT